MKKQGTCTSLLAFALALPLVLLLLAAPAHAGGKPDKTRKSTGDINPTSVPLVEDDLRDLTVAAKTTPEEPIAQELTLAASVETTTFPAGSSDPVLRAQINADKAHQVATGRGVIVAVLDAGFVLDHPALARSFLPDGWDFVDGDSDPGDVGDGIGDDRGVGHGNMVAAMVLNAAPNARILPLRVRDDEGMGSDDAVVEAIAYAIKYGVDIINLSIDQDLFDPARIDSAIKEAKAYGIVVVASAGNDGHNFVPWESSMPAHFAVGAVDDEGVVAAFSNYTDGWSPGAQMIFAPGVNLYGPLCVDGVCTYGFWSGTSFAAGVVSGAVALLKELHPDWDADALQRGVASSVVPVARPEKGKKGTIEGAGRVDLAEVVSR